MHRKTENNSLIGAHYLLVTTTGVDGFCLDKLLWRGKFGSVNRLSWDCAGLISERPMRLQHQQHSAFSLVELLVVIAIIGILIAIVLPTMTKTREQAKAVVCAAQLHQLGLAFSVYATNSQGFMPAWSGVHEYVPGQYTSKTVPPNPSWTEMLMPCFAKPDSQVYRCPAFPGEAINYFVQARWEGINDVYSIKFSRIRTSTKFILSGDCTAPAWYLPPYGTAVIKQDDSDKDDATVKCLLFRGEANGVNMHPGGNNVLFADMHVSTFRSWDSTNLTYSPRAMQDYEDVTQDETP